MKSSHTYHQADEKKPISEETYQRLLSEIESVVSGERNLIANLANCASLFYHTLRYEFNHPINWFGFYLIDQKKNSILELSKQELVLGPFHGKLACTRIKFGKGVCGTCIVSKQIQCVPNVHEFSGHIACDSASNSEICVPLMLTRRRTELHSEEAKEHEDLIGLIDVDSTALDQFSMEVDGKYLNKLAEILMKASDY
ncbi:hypothetical protein C9374_013240 [Naegleria lovaniensis]|uniref:GAF domain-containing protein n=1 Tax=Naegleria lovaniensis TaxID=51637 RepID=A0AA88GYW9_NAELO|nr:uncharacterized protein C9374_013240 [Naegleria lovaniensis]KAG2391755.1 hypothetical protein C9374_013240 [Naegleria lovaniensis]